MLSVLEAYELFRFSEQLSERLHLASSDLESRPGFESEKVWLEQAATLVDAELCTLEPVHARMRLLPEMTMAREEWSASQIGPWVDGLEKLLAGITFHFGSRTPVIEALYPHQKMSLLRRTGLEEARVFWSDFERRLRSSYVERIFAQDEWAFARPVIEQVRAAWATIASTELSAPLGTDERQAIVDMAATRAKRLELVIVQARLLSEAALAPFEGMFASSGLAMKLKRKAPKVSDAPVPESAAPAEVEATVDVALAEEEEAAIEAAPADEEEAPPVEETYVTMDEATPAVEEKSPAREPKKRRAKKTAEPANAEPVG